MWNVLLLPPFVCWFSPDTGDLSLRVGIHSGPVTAGVLIGEKSRFQLFGDTVNTGKKLSSKVKRASAICELSYAHDVFLFFRC